MDVDRTGNDMHGATVRDERNRDRPRVIDAEHAKSEQLLFIKEMDLLKAADIRHPHAEIQGRLTESIRVRRG